MGNAALAWNNLIDRAATVITASPDAADTPADQYLRAGAYEHVLWRWVAAGTSASLLIDFGASVSADTFGIIALTGDDPTIRLRLSLTDPTGVAGEVYDQDVSAAFDADYLSCIHLAAAPKTFRYQLWTFSEAGVATIGAGRLLTSLRDEFTINFAPGFSHTPIRASKDTQGEGGQTFVERRRGHWMVDADFGFLSETDYRAFVRLIDVAMVNEGHLDFLWIKDVDTTHPAEDCIWGFQPQGSPTLIPYTITDVLSKRLQIVERL